MNVLNAQQLFCCLKRKYCVPRVFLRSPLKGQEALPVCMDLMPSLMIQLFSETLQEYGGEAAIKSQDGFELLGGWLSSLPCHREWAFPLFCLCK